MGAQRRARRDSDARDGDGRDRSRRPRERALRLVHDGPERPAARSAAHLTDARRPPDSEEEGDLRMRDLWHVAPRWAHIAVYVWAAVVFAVLILLVLRLVVGRR